MVSRQKISCWTTQDLDYILIQGETLYKSFNKESFLPVNDLQREIHIFECIVSVEMKVENLHDGKTLLGEPFLRNILAVSDNSTGCLSFTCNYTVAIIKYSTTSKSTLYSVFDSYSRNDRRMIDSPFGFSVLLQFADIVQVERYIEEAYNRSNRAYLPYL